jgi:hypothetical protein
MTEQILFFLKRKGTDELIPLPYKILNQEGTTASIEFDQTITVNQDDEIQIRRKAINP